MMVKKRNIDGYTYLFLISQFGRSLCRCQYVSVIPPSTDSGGGGTSKREGTRREGEGACVFGLRCLDVDLRNGYDLFSHLFDQIKREH